MVKNLNKMEKHENWAVQCPEDWVTNEKWNSVINYINLNGGRKYSGQSGAFYGIINNKGCHSFYIPSCKLLSIDEAHSMLFDAPVKYTIYQELMLMEFKKVKSKGKIVIDENGSYQMRKQATDHSFFLWNHSNPNLDLIEYWVDGIKVSTMNVEQVKEFLSKIETK